MPTKASRKGTIAKRASKAEGSIANSESSQKPDSGVAQTVVPRCTPVAERGVRTIEDFSEMMSCLMSDVVMGAVSPNVANAAINAGGKLLKAAELDLKYGTQKQVSMKLSNH